MDRIPVQGVLFKLCGEEGHQLHGDIVHPVVIVSVFGELSLHLKVHGHPVLIPYRRHLCEFNG